MALKIRLARGGAKKRPFYRIVVAEITAPRDGRFLEKIGTYDPRLPKSDEKRVIFDAERIKHWIGVGAKPTDRVSRFLEKAGLLPEKTRHQPIKGKPSKKTLERVKAAEEKAAAKKAAEDAPKEAEKPAEAPEKEAAAEEPTASADTPAGDTPSGDTPTEDTPTKDTPAAEAAPKGEDQEDKKDEEPPKEDASKGEAPQGEAPKDDAPEGDASEGEAPVSQKAGDEEPKDAS